MMPWVQPKAESSALERRGRSRNEEPTYLRIKHSNNLTTLVTHNLPLLHIVQRRHSKSSRIFRIDLEVYLPQMRIFLMSLHWIRPDLLSRRIIISLRRKPPSFTIHCPMYTCVGDYLFETFEFANNEHAVRPRTGVGDLPYKLGRHEKEEGQGT